jgi:DNA primase
MDPDDIVRRAGKDGIELQLDESFTLLDFLWVQEKIAAPTESPEEKAGLKARLEAHIEKISHPEIKRLYRRDLFDEFYRFAYPRRDPIEVRKQAEADADPKTRRWRKISSSDIKSFNEYMRGRLGAAITRGLMYWPDQVEVYADHLAKTPNIDPRIDAILDESCFDKKYNASNFLISFTERGLKPPTPEEFGNLRFPFAWPFFARDTAIPSLRRAVRLYTVIPAIQSELELAQARYESRMNEADIDENRDDEGEKLRLQRRLEELWEDVRAFQQAHEPVAS